MHIHDLTNEPHIAQSAALLQSTFWPDADEALAEVRELVAPGNICRVAVKDDVVIGIIGGQPEYDGHVWELHPLVVREDYRGQGIGSFLLADFEMRVRQQGALTIMLGTDDADNMTSLGGIDLYRDLWAQVRRIANYKRHPYTFYQKRGYQIVGVIPDANGIGKPDILMAKRIYQP